MTPDLIRARVLDFLEPHLGGQPLADSDDYFALGYVNSLFAVQLVTFIERDFSLTLQPGDMNFDNFRTLNGLIHFITTKLPTSTLA